jgi:hypothetical protein
LTQKRPAAWIDGHVVDDFAAQNATSGGSSESDVKELTARPAGSPSCTAVITVTPVTKWPSTWRKRAESTVGGRRGGESGASAAGPSASSA